SLFCARFHPHLNGRDPTCDQSLDHVFMNLVTAATDLERHLACHTFFGDQICNLHCPFFCFSPSCKEIVVLKQKDRDTSIAMQIEHFVDYRAWRAQTTQ